MAGVLGLSACGGTDSGMDPVEAARRAVLTTPSTTSTTAAPTTTVRPTTTLRPTTTTARPTTTTARVVVTRPPTTRVAAPTTTAKPVVTTAKPVPTTTARPTTTTAAKPAGDVVSEIEYGSSGPAVRRLQVALKKAGFDPGSPDGEYGGATLRAVWAYNELRSNSRTSTVTPKALADLEAGWRPEPKRADLGGNRTEIDIARQTLVVYQDNVPRLITHVSSGSGKHYCENAKSKVEGQPPPTLRNGEPKQNCGDAETPTGKYRYGRRESGWYRSELGELYNPVFFNGGIAVHGANSVPKEPASHGCVRIPMNIAEYFPTLVSTGSRVVVF